MFSLTSSTIYIHWQPRDRKFSRRNFEEFYCTSFYVLIYNCITFYRDSGYPSDRRNEAEDPIRLREVRYSPGGEEEEV